MHNVQKKPVDNFFDYSPLWITHCVRMAGPLVRHADIHNVTHSMWIFATLPEWHLSTICVDKSHRSDSISFGRRCAEVIHHHGAQCALHGDRTPPSSRRMRLIHTRRGRTARAPHQAWQHCAATQGNAMLTPRSAAPRDSAPVPRTTRHVLSDAGMPCTASAAPCEQHAR